MPLMNFELFCQNVLEKKGRFLGLDVGEKLIGLALSDINRTISTPFQVMQRTQWKKDVVTFSKVIQDHRIAGIVIGFPLNMNGTEGPRCQSIRQFAQNLLAVMDLPLCLWDERLSTMAVTRTLLEADLSRDKRKQVVDKMAAAYILQGFLDAYHRAHRGAC
jgi:putative Holliday junction resolvase